MSHGELTADTPLPAGTVVAGRYRVLGPLGSGAMGTVVRVEHLLMHKQFALKLLHATIASAAHDEMVARLQREAQAAGRIDHPNVCAAVDYGRTDAGASFLVMELLEGETLEHVLRRERRLPVDRAAPILEQVLAGLAAAHALGVVHRDLKPENVMLTERDGFADHVKILDFGVAMVDAEAAAPRLTRVGVIYGTPEYMAPEQATGGKVDARADLYSLGVMAFELLTGRLPFEAPDAYDLLGLHLTRPPPTLREAAPDLSLPEAFEPLVARLLAKRRDDRFPSAEAAREALLAAWAGPPPSSPRPAVARHRLRFIAAAAAVCALGAAGLVLAPTDAPPPAAPPAASDVAAPPPSFALHRDSGALAARRARLFAARDAFAARPDVQPALASLAAGHPQPAVLMLGALRDATPSNPHAHYHLGLAHAAAGTWRDELDAYAHALRLEPDYAADGALLGAVLHHLQSPRGEIFDAARALVVAHLAPTAAERLAELARLDPRAVVRQRARALLAETGRLEHLEPWNRLSVELRAAATCEDRLVLLRALRALREPRALDVLRVVDGVRSGCGRDGRADCNACLRDELTAAVAELSPP